MNNVSCISNAPQSLVAKKAIHVEAIKMTLPKGYFLATTDKELERIKYFKKSYYDDNHSSVKDFHDDGLDKYAYVIYATNDNGKIIGTSRLLLDGEWGFPEEKILPKSVHLMRNNGRKLAELGRLLITEDKVNGLRIHYQLIHRIANIIGIDKVLIVMKQSNISSHKKMMEVEVLSMQMGNSWDEEHAPLCLISWDIKADQPKFHQWVSRCKDHFSFNEWNGYSDYHLGVFTSLQKEVYQYVAHRVFGNVLDLGCGTGRIMGYLQDNSKINRYTGVDSSLGMIQRSSWLKKELSFDKAQFIHSNIADIKGKYNSIFSIHSFYSWSDQDKLLSLIYSLLEDQGIFILVTPNNDFDEGRLSHVVKQELLGHPHYEAFMSINYAIASTAKAKGVYVSLDTLIDQVKQAGFSIRAAHNRFFLGGASYLELEKKN